jgi:hypothetical protein
MHHTPFAVAPLEVDGAINVAQDESLGVACGGSSLLVLCRTPPAAQPPTPSPGTSPGRPTAGGKDPGRPATAKRGRTHTSADTRGHATRRRQVQVKPRAVAQARRRELGHLAAASARGQLARRPAVGAEVYCYVLIPAALAKLVNQPNLRAGQPHSRAWCLGRLPPGCQ